MSVLPYGGNVIVNSISSSIERGNYFKNRSDYVTSEDEISTMQFSYKEQDGTKLVGIDTNLEIVEWTTTTNPKTFTLSNSNIFGTTTKPYINLQCNNVKSYVSFMAYGNQVNKWEDFEVDDNTITVSGKGDAYATIAKYCTISWSTSSNQTLFFEGQEGQNSRETWYACKAFYNYLNSNNKVVSGSTVLWSVNIGERYIPKIITIPKLNGTISQLKADNETLFEGRFINYFVIGQFIHMYTGFSYNQPETKYYINGTTKLYDERGWLRELDGKHYLVHDKGIPVFYENNKIKGTWNNDLFYVTQEKIEDFDGNEVYYFISPSTSKIYCEWNLGEGTNYCSCQEDYCDDDCPPDCEDDCPPDCEDDCPPDCEDDCPPDCEDDCPPDCEDDCPPDCDDDCPPDGGYVQWKGKFKFNDSIIINYEGNLVRYGKKDEEVTVYGEIYFDWNPSLLYYDIGNGEYTRDTNIVEI